MLMMCSLIHYVGAIDFYSSDCWELVDQRSHTLLESWALKYFFIHKEAPESNDKNGKKEVKVIY